MLDDRITQVTLTEVPRPAGNMPEAILDQLSQSLASSPAELWPPAPYAIIQGLLSEATMLVNGTARRCWLTHLACPGPRASHL